jgi:hypothetical protein
MENFCTTNVHSLQAFRGSRHQETEFYRFARYSLAPKHNGISAENPKPPNILRLARVLTGLYSAFSNPVLGTNAP